MMPLSATEVNLWGFVALAAFALVILLTGLRSTQRRLLAGYVGGYALWSVAFFLPPALRAPLAWAGALCALLGGACVLAYASRDLPSLARASRQARNAALAITGAGALFGLAAVWATFRAADLSSAQVRASFLLWSGMLPFVACVGGALFLFALRGRGSSFALRSPAGWTILGIAALAGLVGARYLLALATPLSWGMALGYTLGIGAAAVILLARPTDPPRARALSWGMLSMLLAGMLVYVLAGGVGGASGALANHVGRFVAFGMTFYGAVEGARP